MKKLTWYLSVLALTVIGFSEPLHSAEQKTTGHDVLTDCSLALDMVNDSHLNAILSTGKPVPLPTTAQQGRAAQCIGYVVGLKDAIFVSQIIHEKNGSAPLVCLPEDSLNNEVALRIVLKYLQDNSRLLDQPQATVVFNAFRSTFPCKKK